MALEDYKALFGNQFDDIVDAIMTGGLTPQVEAMIVGTIDQMVFNVNVFSENINKTVINMGNAGISKNVIKSTLNTDMQNGGKIFGQLRNETKETLVGGVNKASGIGQYETYLDNGVTEKSMFVWVTASVHRISQDCMARSGAEKTFKDWESEGLPGSGATVCGGYCYCVVDPVGKMDKEVKINTESIKKEKGATIRKPAGWSPTMTTAQAAKWNATSKFQGTFYHGTTTDGVAGIRKSGYDLSKSRTGQMFGRGAYGTSQERVASLFADGGDVMQIMYNVKNPLNSTDDFFSYMVNGHLPATEEFVLHGRGKLSFAKGYEKYAGRGKRNFAKRKLEWRKREGHFEKFSDLKGMDNIDDTLTGQFRHLGLKSEVAAGTKEFKEALELGNKWFDYLDDLVMAGDKRAIGLEKSMWKNTYGARWNRDFGDLFSDFAESLGYDGIKISNVPVPHQNNLFDDYFISLSKESVTAIVD